METSQYRESGDGRAVTVSKDKTFFCVVLYRVASNGVRGLEVSWLVARRGTTLKAVTSAWYNVLGTK